MKHALARRPSASIVIATIALIVAASGTAVAATNLVAGDKLIKKHSLSGSRLRAHTLTGSQINLSKLGKVSNASNADSATNAQNAVSAQTATNATTVGGKSIRWLLMDPGGVIVDQSGGFTVSFHQPGNYIIDAGQAVTGHALVVSDAVAGGDIGTRGISLAGPCGTGSEAIDCSSAYNDGNHIFVATLNTTNASNENHSFYLVMY